MFKCQWKFCLTTIVTTCLLVSKRCEAFAEDEDNKNETSTTTWTDVITSPPTSISTQTSKNTSAKEAKRFLLIAILDLGRNSVCNDHPDELSNNAFNFELGLQRLQIIKWCLDKIEKTENKNRTVEFIVIDTCGNLSLASSNIVSYAAQYNLIPKPKTITNINTNVNSNINTNINTTESIENGDESCEISNENTGGFLVASVLGTPISVGLKNVIPTLPLYLPTQNERLEEQAAAIAMAQRLGWEKAIVISENEILMKNFGQLASRQINLCIVQYVLLTENKTLGNEMQDEILQIRVKTVILFGKSKKVVAALLEAEALKDLTWIVVTQGEMNWNAAKQNKSRLEKTVGFSIERNFLRAPEFFNDYRDSSSFANNSWEDDEALDIMRTILNMASKPIGCQHSNEVVDDFEARYKLGLSYELPKFAVKALNFDSQGRLQSINIGEYTSKNGLELNSSYIESSKVSFKDDETCKQSEECVCKNISPLPPPSLSLRWRFETWVTVVVTIGAVGVVLTACIALFIMCKACTEVLDGSQVLSLIFLLILMLMYMALIPYGFSSNELVCALRSASTRLVYSMTFAIMCTRSIMLATADTDGLPGHISGWVQALLFVFMFGVQVSILVQEWFGRDSFLKPQLTSSSPVRCADDGFKFLYCLSYVMLLLFIQLALSPFIVKSQRNYKEGLLFSLASLACLFVWIGWVTCYVLLSDNLGSQWHDIAVCCGLVVTPTIINLIVFVPKCYQMSSPTLYKSQATSRGCDSSVHFHGLDFSGLDFSTTTSRLSPCEAINLHGTTTTCSTTDDVLLMEAQQQNGHTSLHSDLYGSFKESSWKPVARSQQGYHRPTLHLVDSPSFDEMSQNYPTYKLDRNSVVDTSIRWERYSYPNNRTPSSNHPSGNYPSGNYPSISNVPPPPPPPPLPRSQSNQSQSKMMGTRL